MCDSEAHAEIGQTDTWNELCFVVKITPLWKNDDSLFYMWQFSNFAFVKFPASMGVQNKSIDKHVS